MSNGRKIAQDHALKTPAPSPNAVKGQVLKTPAPSPTGNSTGGAGNKKG